eukprot:200552_1
MRCSRAFASSLLYLIGCILLLPASSLILPSFPIEQLYIGSDFALGIIFYVIACSFLTIGGILDFVSETHTCIKTRKSNVLDPFLAQYEKDTSQQSKQQMHNILGWWIALFYLIGGVFFLLGSIAYLPVLDHIEIVGESITLVGTWIFRFGSISYICGSVSSLYKIYDSNRNIYVAQDAQQKLGQLTHNKTGKTYQSNDVSLTDLGTDTMFNQMEQTYENQLRKKKCINSTCMWRTVLCLYIIGALLFIVGGIFFETGEDGGEFIWLLGSIFFALGASVGFIENVRSK